MVPGGAGCLSQVVVEEEEEEEVEGADVEAAFCSPAPAQACRYGTPAVDTTTEELWVEAGADSEPSSAGGGGQFESEVSFQSYFYITVNFIIWDLNQKFWTFLHLL